MGIPSRRRSSAVAAALSPGNRTGWSVADLEARERGQLPIHLRQKLVPRHEQVGPEHQERLPGIRCPRGLPGVGNHLPTKSGTVEYPGKDPGHEVEPGALVPAHGEEHPLVGPGRVGYRLAVEPHHPALWQRLARQGFLSDTPVGRHRGGDVELEWDLGAGGDRHRQRVCAHQRLDSTPGWDAVPRRHRHVEGDKPPFPGERGVHPGGTGMVRSPGTHPGHPALLGQCDRFLGRRGDDGRADPVVAVDQGARSRLVLDPDLGSGVDPAGNDRRAQGRTLMSPCPPRPRRSASMSRVADTSACSGRIPIVVKTDATNRCNRSASNGITGRTAARFARCRGTSWLLRVPRTPRGSAAPRGRG